MKKFDNQSKQYRIYLKTTREWVEVSKEVYEEHTRFHDAFRKRHQSHGQCVCPKNKFWLCDADCLTCEFHRAGDHLSLDYTTENEDGDTCSPLDALADTAPSIEDVICDKAELDQLFARLNELMPEARDNNNRIDFSNQPEGKRYCPMPVTREQIIEWDLAPRYVVTHKFSNTPRLCYMVLCDEKIARECVQAEKAACKKRERENRCIITSPITGKPICCPDSRSCIGCEYTAMENVSKVGGIAYERLIEETGYEKGAHDLTSDEALTNIETAEILEELSSTSEKLAEILKLRLQGLEAKEISEKLGIKKSTLYDDLKIIAAIASKHLN